MTSSSRLALRAPVPHRRRGADVVGGTWHCSRPTLGRRARVNGASAIANSGTPAVSMASSDAQRRAQGCSCLNGV